MKKGFATLLASAAVAAALFAGAPASAASCAPRYTAHHWRAHRCPVRLAAPPVRHAGYWGLKHWGYGSYRWGWWPEFAGVGLTVNSDIGWGYPYWAYYGLGGSPYWFAYDYFGPYDP
jgi:hypothetical protein